MKIDYNCVKKDLGVQPEFSATGQGLGGADRNIKFKDLGILSSKHKQKKGKK